MLQLAFTTEQADGVLVQIVLVSGSHISLLLVAGDVVLADSSSIANILLARYVDFERLIAHSVWKRLEIWQTLCDLCNSYITRI